MGAVCDPRDYRYAARGFRVRRVLLMRSGNNTIALRAHAKVNLVLRVGAPVDDPGAPTHGYHPVCSYMSALELCDRVEIERAEETRYDIRWDDGRGVEWDVERDLAARAHRALCDRVGHELACVIRVRKSIPAGGGLGGGSSDAGGVLVGLNELFGLGIAGEALRELAAGLGADVPFFVDPGHEVVRPAVVTGFGETIERAGRVHAGREVTLILPGFGCPTGDVYRAFDATGPAPVPEEGGARSLAVSGVLEDALVVNDLGGAACAVAPALGDLRRTIAARLGCPVHVSGSGSTLFVLGRADGGAVREVAPDCALLTTRLC